MPGYPPSPYGIQDDYGIQDPRDSLYGTAMPNAPAPAPSASHGAPAWETPPPRGALPGTPMPSTDSYQQAIEDELRRRREHKTPIWRQIIGGLASRRDPALGERIQDPAAYKFGQQLPLLQAKSKAEQDELTKQSLIAQRQESEARQRALTDQAKETSLDKQDVGTELQPIQRMPSSSTMAPLDPASPGTKALQQDPPPLAPPSPTGPVDLMAPTNPIAAQDPALSAMRSPAVATGGGRVPLDTSLATQASGGRPAPQGMERVRPTAKGVEVAKKEAAQVNWPSVTQGMADAVPEFNLKVGDKIDPELAKGVVDIIKEHAKNPKLNFEHFTDENTGDVTTVGFDPATGKPVSQVVTPGIAKKRAPVEPGSLQIQEDQEGKPVLFNSKTGEVRPAEGIQKSGTKNKADEAIAKKLDPIKKSLTVADDYLKNGVFTGPGDIALQEAFFNLTKPDTGFRMNQQQMNKLADSRSWMSSLKGQAYHAIHGTWFDDKQRAEMVQTMKDVARANGVSVESIAAGKGVKSPSYPSGAEGANSLSVKLKSGSSFTFPDQSALDKAKKEHPELF